MLDDEMQLMLFNDLANDDKEFITEQGSGCGGIFLIGFVILVITIMPSLIF